MDVTPERVRTERDWVREREAVVALINDTRASLETHFDTRVDRVTADQYRSAVDHVFADGDRAVNVAALVAILRVLAEATFHYADVRTHGGPGEAAGADDLDAALAAGFQTRLPGWAWRESQSPFGVDPVE